MKKKRMVVAVVVAAMASPSCLTDQERTLIGERERAVAAATEKASVTPAGSPEHASAMVALEVAKGELERVKAQAAEDRSAALKEGIAAGMKSAAEGLPGAMAGGPAAWALLLISAAGNAYQAHQRRRYLRGATAEAPSGK
jgi:hypothetical protein